MPDGHHHVDRPNPVGPDGFTRLAGDAPNAYAAFVGAEAELARLKAAADLVGHQGACLVDPCDCWMADLAPLLEDWSR